MDELEDMELSSEPVFLALLERDGDFLLGLVSRTPLASISPAASICCCFLVSFLGDLVSVVVVFTWLSAEGSVASCGGGGGGGGG